MSKLQISNDRANRYAFVCSVIKNIVFELNYARNKISILFI